MKAWAGAFQKRLWRDVQGHRKLTMPPYLVHPSVLLPVLPPGQTWGDPYPPQSRDWVLLLRAQLELCSQQFYVCTLQSSHPSPFIIVTRPQIFNTSGPPSGSPTTETLKTYERTVTITTRPLSSSGVSWESAPTCQTPLMSLDVWGDHPVYGPNTVYLAPPPPVDQAETLLPQFFRPALI